MFNLAAVLSAVLFAATCVLWVRTCFIDVHYGVVRVSVASDMIDEYRSGLFFGGGRVSLVSTEWSYTPSEYALRRGTPPVTGQRFGWSAGRFQELWGERNLEFPFGFGSGEWGPALVEFHIFAAAPYWFVAALLALLPISWVGRRLNWKMMRPALALELYAVFVVWGILMIKAAGDSFNIIHALLLLGLSAYLICRPFAAVTRWLWARSQIKAGLCSSCGYDLRATPDRCPECGTVPKHAIAPRE
jgi:hypothetical protein